MFRLYSVVGCVVEVCSNKSSKLVATVYWSERNSYFHMSNEKQPSPFPSSWAKRGFVYVHPKDHRVYPKEFFELDPNDFVVPPSGEKRIENWGLENSRFNTNGGKVDWTEYTNLYIPLPTPYDQYIGALAKRKMEQVASPEVQDACKTTLKVRSKFNPLYTYTL